MAALSLSVDRFFPSMSALSERTGGARPRLEPGDASVSSELSFSELVRLPSVSSGTGGTSYGESRPFFVVGGPLLAEREAPEVNRPLALGAEATRRMKRPTALGLSGLMGPRAGERVASAGVESCDEVWSASAILDLERLSKLPYLLSERAGSGRVGCAV